MTDDLLALEHRTALPDALRVLLETYPREDWTQHKNFAGLVEFWLGRHMMFRQLTGALQEDAEQAMDGKMDLMLYKPRLARFGGGLVQELHGHHNIEDHHYFPQLSGLEPSLQRGFDILDKDHPAMDGLLSRFANSANGVLQDQSEIGVFREELLSFNKMLDRHLVDEEELIVPVILKNGSDVLH